MSHRSGGEVFDDDKNTHVGHENRLTWHRVGWEVKASKSFLKQKVQFALNEARLRQHAAQPGISNHLPGMQLEASRTYEHRRQRFNQKGLFLSGRPLVVLEFGN